MLRFLQGGPGPGASTLGVALGTLCLLAIPASAQDSAEDAAVLTAEAFASVCAPWTDGETQGVLAGLVYDLNSELPLPGVVIRADWGEADLQPGELRVGGAATASSDRTVSIEQGVWYICGVTDGEVRVEAAIGDSIYAVETVRIDAGTVRRLDFPIAFSRPGERTGVFGYVTDQTSRAPVADAELQLVGEAGTVVSGRNGFFAIDSVRPGLHALRVQHIGYAPVTVPVMLEPGQPGEVEVRLSAEAIELDGLEVTVRSGRRLRGLREMERRMELGFGTFLDAEGLERSGVYYLGEALRTIPGAGYRTFGWGVTAVHTIRRNGRNCRPAVFIDGRRDRSENVLTWFTSSQIAAVELHKGPAVPAEFVTTDERHLCGVISAWTR